MMSNTPSSLQSRQRLHKRQNSTPVAFEAMKVPMPPTTVQRHSLHRRGQSYDMARTPIRRQNHNGSAVSINTNIGPIHGQPILREAQQQKMTRPGQQPIHPQGGTSTSQQQCDFQTQPPSFARVPYEMQMSALMSMSQDMSPHSAFQNFPMTIPPEVQATLVFDENTHNYFPLPPQSQQASQLMPQQDRRMSQPDVRIRTGMRPYTPTHQIQTAHFPLTPASTPMGQRQPQGTKSTRWQPQEDNIISPRPVSMQKSRSLQGIAEHQEIQSFTEVFEAPELPPGQTADAAVEPAKKPRALHSKAHSISAISTESRHFFGEISADVNPLEELAKPDFSTQPPSSPGRPTLSPRRMSISDLNLDPGIKASIEETNITLDDIAQYIEGPDPKDQKWICKFEGCDKKFGRKENIKSHVQTHLNDRQFRCDHCNKSFVRGHDLKRHAKIHTGTKAYACLCGNAFARHDALTRHRQRGMCIGAFEGIVRKEIKRGRPRKHRPEMDDRLDKATKTRRKQKAPSSQGPGDNNQYASSASSCSMSSWGSPPTETMDHLSIHGQSPAVAYEEAMDLFGLSPQDMGITSQDQMLITDIYSFTPPTSPGFSTGNKPTPSYRELTPADIASFSGEPAMTQLTGQPMSEYNLLPPHTSSQVSGTMLDESHASQAYHSPAPTGTTTSHDFVQDLPPMPQQSTITATQASSLPSLSHSSSPPPQEPGSALVFDFHDDTNPLRMSTMSAISSMSFGLSAVSKAMDSHPLTQTSGEETQRNEFDSFLDYNDDSTIALGMAMGMPAMDSNDSFFNDL